MSVQVPTSDAGLLDLLRITGSLSVAELADAMGVTATAVRQRLVRLLGRRAIQREATRHGRGRPKDLYRLAEQVPRPTDSEFIRLALTLWEETCQTNDPESRRETLRRIAHALASGHADQIQGETPAEQREWLANLLKQQQIPVSAKKAGAAANGLEGLGRPIRGIALEQIKAVSQMVKTIGIDRVQEMLSLIKKVGGVARFKNLLDAMELSEVDDGKS
jgi:predicted ArsR family transcriptional regulator